jgi:peroxiredoxin
MEIDLDTQAIRNHDKPLQVAGLQHDRLPAILDSEPLVILYFLRHFGCAHCKYLVRQLYRLNQEMTRFPNVIFVHMEPIEQGEQFFKQYYPGAAHISDPKRELYQLFGIRSQKGMNLLNPVMLYKTAQRVISGYSNNVKPTSDPFMLSGMFLFREGQPIWMHRASYAGDDQKAVNMLKVLGKKGGQQQAQRPAPSESPASEAAIREEQ